MYKYILNDVKYKMLFLYNSNFLAKKGDFFYESDYLENTLMVCGFVKSCYAMFMHR